MWELLFFVAAGLSLMISPAMGIINYLKIRKMDQALATYEAFLQQIAGFFTTISTSLSTIAAGINPSGLSAADAAQLQTDLGTIAAQGQAVAAAATAAAGNAGAGAPAPATPPAPAPVGSTGNTQS